MASERFQHVSATYVQTHIEYLIPHLYSNSSPIFILPRPHLYFISSPSLSHLKPSPQIPTSNHPLLSPPSFRVTGRNTDVAFKIHNIGCFMLRFRENQSDWIKPGKKRQYFGRELDWKGLKTVNENHSQVSGGRDNNSTSDIHFYIFPPLSFFCAVCFSNLLFLFLSNSYFQQFYFLTFFID